MKRLLLVIATFAFVSCAFAHVPKTASPAGAKVYLLALENGATIKGSVKVVMGLSGMGVAPGGVDLPDSGHHLILNDAIALNKDMPVPVDDKHRHFGKGQTEASLDP